MKINLKFLQEGGTTPDQTASPSPAPAAQQPDQGAQGPQGGQDPLAQIVQMFVQGLQNQDCAALAQGAQAFIQMVQQSQQQGPSEQPVYMKKGGKVVMKKKVAKPGMDKDQFKPSSDAQSPENAKKGTKLKK